MFTRRFEDSLAEFELAFRLNETKEVRGARPDGTLAAAEVRVAGIVPFLVMKGLTMGGPRRRYRRKDAYDVFYCVDTYPGGAAGLAEAFRPHLGDPLVRAGLAAIRRQFNSPYGTGPIYVADRRGVEDRAARDLLERDAFQKVDSFLRRLGVE